MKKALLVLGVLVLTGVSLLFWYRHDSATPPPPSDNPESQEQAQAATPPRETAPPPERNTTPEPTPEAPVLVDDAAEESEDSDDSVEESEEEWALTFLGIVENLSSGERVGDAMLSLYLYDEVIAEAEGGEEGDYHLDATLDAEDVEEAILVCEAPGYARSEKPLDDLGALESGRQVRLDFFLDPGARLYGMVADAVTKAPIEGVKVALSTSGGGFMQRVLQEDGPPIVAKSAADGRYELSSLAPGSYTIHVNAREMNYVLPKSAQRSLSLAEGQERQLDLALTEGAVLKGTVTTQDRQVPEEPSRVQLMPANPVERVLSDFDSLADIEDMGATCGEDGNFEMKGLEFDTPYRAVASAKGYADFSSAPFSITPGRSPHILNAVLSHGSTIRGVARFESGALASDIEISLMPDFSQIMSGAFSGIDTSAEADEKGAFVIENVPAGDFTLIAETSMRHFSPFGGEGFGQKVSVDGINDLSGVELIVPEEDQEDEPVRGNGVIAGRVLTDSGDPATGLTVQARAAEGSEQKKAATDEAGAFRIEGLAAAYFDVSVNNDEGSAEQKQVAVGSNITLQIKTAAKVSGVVLTASGVPVTRCRVQLELKNGDSTFSFDPKNFEKMFGSQDSGATTDENGNFEISGVEPGAYVAKAIKTGVGGGDSAEFAVAEGERKSGIRIELKPGVRFSGVVRDVSGRLVAAAHVVLTATSSGNPFEQQMARFMPGGMKETAGEDHTGDDGVFAIEGIPAGEYEVQASHANYAKTAIPGVLIDPGRDVAGFEIVLSSGGCIAGTPLFHGAPKPGAMVQIIGDAGMQMATTDAAGHFEVCSLTPGSYMVQVMDMGAMMSGQLSDMMPIQKTADVRDGETTEVEFAPLPGSVAVQGSVRGKLGTITTVSLRKPDSPDPASIDPLDMQAQMEMMQHMVGTAMVSADGTFNMDGVPPGDYILEVYAVDMDMQNPDFEAMMEMDRSPAVRREITIEPGVPPVFDLEIPAKE